MKQKNYAKKKKQKSRDNTGIISGLNPIYEVLRNGQRAVHHVWIADKDSSGIAAKVISLADKKGIPVERVTSDVLFSITRIEKHQGIAARVDEYRYSSLNEILSEAKKDPSGPFILILDNILDPQNLGSIIRSAHLTGVSGIVIQERNSASIGPASVRASAGAVEYIKIARVTNIVRTIEELKKEGIWVIGAEGDSGQNLYSIDISGGYAVVMGSEGRGMRRLVKESCDQLVSIPMNPVKGGVDSYNVSVATGIILSEINRQRRYKNSK